MSTNLLDPKTEIALTLWRPWPRFVVNGDKPIENRNWPPPRWLLGRRLWIHAGKTYDVEAEKKISSITGLDDETLGFCDSTAHPLGIVGSVRVVGWCSWETFQKKLAFRGGLPEAKLIMEAQRRWFFGPFGWLLTDQRTLSKPIKCAGAQKLWAVPPELVPALWRAA